jgi:hypothetical protein
MQTVANRLESVQRVAHIKALCEHQNYIGGVDTVHRHGVEQLQSVWTWAVQPLAHSLLQVSLDDTVGVYTRYEDEFAYAAQHENAVQLQMVNRQLEHGELTVADVLKTLSNVPLFDAHVSQTADVAKLLFRLDQYNLLFAVMEFDLGECVSPHRASTVPNIPPAVLPVSTRSIRGAQLILFTCPCTFG